MKILLIFLSIFFFNYCAAQQVKAKPIIDVTSFESSAHHWYDIFDKSNVINARKDQPRYKVSEINGIGDNIILYQKDNGGWPKNYDMLAILNGDQKDSLIKVKNILNTTFDNSTTHSQVACLANIYVATKIEKYKAAALKGIGYILSAQYKNGGWPQYYPLEKNYSSHITFNDDVFSGIMFLLKDITGKKPPYNFLDAQLQEKVSIAYKKGIECILKTQIKDAGKPTAWCQQYDESTLEPAWARAFEPPGICNAESAHILMFLMSIESPSKEIINSIENAVTWFDESKIMNTRIQTIEAADTNYKYRHSHTDKVVVNDPKAPPIWTRYYEIKTHRPLFCNRDSKLVYSLAEVDRERRDGYGWYTYEPQKVLINYNSWRMKWAAGRNVLGS